MKKNIFYATALALALIFSYSILGAEEQDYETNAPPNFDPISDFFREDFGQFMINLSDWVSDPEDPDGSLTYNWTLNDTSIISLHIENVTGIATFTTLSNASGSTLVTISVVDTGGLSNSTEFVITISAVNDAPWIDPLPTITMNEDNGTSTVYTYTELKNAFRDVEEDQNPTTMTLLSQTGTSVIICSLTPDLTCGTVTNQYGSSIITIEMNDSEGLSTNALITINVNSVNDQPWIDPLLSDPSVYYEDDPASVAIPHATLDASFRDVEDDHNPSSIGINSQSNVTVVSCSIVSNDLRCSPQANQSGSSQVNISFTDSGGLSTSDTVTVTVLEVNDAPWSDPIADPSAVNEDSGLQDNIVTAATINTAFRDVENDQSFSSCSIYYQNDSSVIECVLDGSYNIDCTTQANKSGTNTINISCCDSGGACILMDPFTIIVNQVNDQPWWDTITNGTISIDEDASNVNVSNQVYWQNYFRDVENDQNPTGTNSVDDNSSDVTCNLVSGDIICTAENNASGVFILTITAQDQPGGYTIIQSTEVNLVGVNDAPWSDAIADPSAVNEDSGLQDNIVTAATINTAFRDVEEDQAFTYCSVHSQSNTSVISCVLDGSYNVDCTTEANMSGTSTINLSCCDSSSSCVLMDLFTITVNAVNDAPWVDQLANVTMDEDNGSSTVYTSQELYNSFRDVEEDQNPTSTTLLSQSNDSVVNCSYGGMGPAIFCQTVANASGENTLTIEMNDSSDAAVREEITIIVNPVNDAPWSDPITDPSAINEDSGLHDNIIPIATIHAAFRDVERDQNFASYSIFNQSNSSVVNCYVTVDGVDCETQANMSGTSTITLLCEDGDGASTEMDPFTITVDAVNDEPWIDQLANVTMDEDNGSSTIYTTNELRSSFRDVEEDRLPTSITLLSQTNSSVVSCMRSLLNGDLICETEANQSGENTLTIEMNDSSDAAVREEITIIVNSVNDAPWWEELSNTTTVDEDTLNNNISVFIYWQDHFRDVEDDKNPSNPTITTNDSTTMNCSITDGDMRCDSLNNASGSIAITLSAQDSSGSSATINFEIGINATNDTPWIDLDRPLDNATNGTNNLDFTYTPHDVESNAVNCSLVINDEVNVTDTSPTLDVVNNLTTYLYDGEYNWSVNCTDSENEGASETRNLSVRIDVTPPNVYLESPEDNKYWSTSNAVTFYYNVSDDSDIKNCTLILNYEDINATSNTITKDTTQYFSTSIENGEYYWSVNCTDENNNIGNSVSYNITIDYTPPPQISITMGSSGGKRRPQNITNVTNVTPPAVPIPSLPPTAYVPVTPPPEAPQPQPEETTCGNKRCDEEDKYYCPQECEGVGIYIILLLALAAAIVAASIILVKAKEYAAANKTISTIRARIDEGRRYIEEDIMAAESIYMSIKPLYEKLTKAQKKKIIGEITQFYNEINYEKGLINE
ncbi:MAG: tandem-95 repeat protein [Candidatus Nanoarchaeia archaeon]